MDLTDITQLIQSDQGLSAKLKEELLSDENKTKLDTLLSGATGAGLGLALAKYKKMSKASQLILSGLGFGAGVLVYKYWNRERFASYNDKSQSYEINK